MGLLVAGFDYSPVARRRIQRLVRHRARPGARSACRASAASSAGSARRTRRSRSRPTISIRSRAAERGLSQDRRREPVAVVEARDREGEARLPLRSASSCRRATSAAPEGAGGLLMFAMNFAPEAEAEFNAWYDEEHIPRAVGGAGVPHRRGATGSRARTATASSAISRSTTSRRRTCARRRRGRKRRYTPWTAQGAAATSATGCASPCASTAAPRSATCKVTRYGGKPCGFPPFVSA